MFLSVISNAVRNLFFHEGAKATKYFFFVSLVALWEYFFNRLYIIAQHLCVTHLYVSASLIFFTRVNRLVSLRIIKIAYDCHVEEPFVFKSI